MNDDQMTPGACVSCLTPSNPDETPCWCRPNFKVEMRFAEALGSVEGESTAEAINVKDGAVHVEEETATDSIVS